MSLSPGSRLGPYDVIALIGAGGMGEVYRARDARLARDVAIKVLPDAVGPDPERAARFQREARALAALSHPNIAAIHGVEEVGAAGPGQAPVLALVLELIEGETLADRLLRGPLPADEALAIAEQIADALEAAHQKGIVHRDLKPANVKISPAGVVKVLDFGLARIVADASPDLATMTAATSGAGVALGTPAYMAPEQAQGRPVDRRADVWAFGVLLYEMLTGERPFAGRSVQETLAAVLAAEPDWSRVPARLQPLLRRCLARDPRHRLRDVGDFRFLIDGPTTTEGAVAGRSRSRAIAIASVGVAVVAVAFAAWTSLRSQPGAPPEPVRLTTLLPPGVSVIRGPGFASSVALSPDGHTLVVAGTSNGGQRLYRRERDRLDATPIPGTERGSSPFFSWDGAWIGFVADGQLKRIPVAGGTAVDITPLSGFPSGASWGPDDRIVFASGADARLLVVDAGGGEVEELTDVEAGSSPDVLPDGSVLFQMDDWVHALDRTSGRISRLVQGVTPRYADGHVILSRGTTLLAAPVDLSRHALTGPVVPLVEGVALEGTTGTPRHYAIARSGTLAYVPASQTYTLAIVSPDGTERVLSDGHPVIQNPQFSPDGLRVAVAASRRPGEPTDIWIHELDAGTSTRLTFDGARAPVWMGDNTSVTYSRLGDAQGIYVKSADGHGDETQVLPLDAFHWLVGWTPDRRTLAYGLMEMGGAVSSILAVADGQSRRIVGPASTWGGRLSPDGQWLVYYLLDAGTFGVYVTPFPGAGARWLIAEGSDPTWGPDGTEVYYRNANRLMAARIDRTAGIRVLSHRVAIEPFLPPLYDDYDVHPDGRMLVVARPATNTEGREVTIVVDWFTELRRLMSAAGAD